MNGLLLIVASNRTGQTRESRTEILCCERIEPYVDHPRSLPCRGLRDRQAPNFGDESVMYRLKATKSTINLWNLSM